MKSVYYFLIPLLLLLGACTYIGGTKELSEPVSSPGVETVPFYIPGTSSFNTGSAISDELAKKKEAARLAEERDRDLKAKFSAPTTLVDNSSDNPYVAPKKINQDELPEAIQFLPKDNFGYVDWGAAIIQGAIKPRWSTNPKDVGEDPETLDMDIVFAINDRLMNNVLFSHKKHTAWLTCTNCHPSVFNMQKGSNKFVMQDIWNGLYCGKCHGKVAFQPKGFENCQRCHSVKKKTFGIE